MARIASYSGNYAPLEPEKPPKSAAAAQQPAAAMPPVTEAAAEAVPAPLAAAAAETGAENVAALPALLKGAAETACDFLDQIVNPWAAADLAEVAAGQAIIKRHEEGESVQALQQMLQQAGAELAPSGSFDAATAAALAAFQQQHSLPDTGLLDQHTLQQLEQTLAKQAVHLEGIEALKAMPSAELHRLGRQNPEAFFKALLPSALESERAYGVPAEVTLAQGAMESDFARAPIGGFNIFGIKGVGPAGSVNVRTREVVKGQDIYINANFARYNNYHEAVKEHGKLFQNGYYDKPMQQFAQDGDVMAFVDGFSPTYATEPRYARTLKYVMERYNLLELVAAAR